MPSSDCLIQLKYGLVRGTCASSPTCRMPSCIRPSPSRWVRLVDCSVASERQLASGHVLIGVPPTETSHTLITTLKKLIISTADLFNLKYRNVPRALQLSCAASNTHRDLCERGEGRRPPQLIFLGSDLVGHLEHVFVRDHR